MTVFSAVVWTHGELSSFWKPNRPLHSLPTTPRTPCAPEAWKHGLQANVTCEGHWRSFDLDIKKEDQENAFIDTCSRTYVQWLGRCTWPANTYWHYSTLILGYSGEQKRVLQSLITFLFASFWQSKLPLPSDLARFLNINSLDLKAWHPLHDKELQHSIVIAPAWPQNVSLRLET